MHYGMSEIFWKIFLENKKYFFKKVDFAGIRTRVFRVKVVGKITATTWPKNPHFPLKKPARNWCGATSYVPECHKLVSAGTTLKI